MCFLTCPPSSTCLTLGLGSFPSEWSLKDCMCLIHVSYSDASKYPLTPAEGTNTWNDDKSQISHASSTSFKDIALWRCIKKTPSNHKQRRKETIQCFLPLKIVSFFNKHDLFLKSIRIVVNGSFYKKKCHWFDNVHVSKMYSNHTRPEINFLARCGIRSIAHWNSRSWKAKQKVCLIAKPQETHVYFMKTAPCLFMLHFDRTKYCHT